MAAPKRVPVPSAKPPVKPAVKAPARPANARAAAKKPESPAVPKPAPRRRIDRSSTLRVLIAGASGMIGTELVRQLESAGHTVQTLVRREPMQPSEFTWAPDAKILDFRLLDDVDAVINLSGASLNRLPWTGGWKKEILRSRIKATSALVEAMGMASSPPPVFLSGSAVGFYGNRPGETLTESSSKGTGFLADVVEEWEATARLVPASTRTVLLRTGVVLGTGGALGPLKALTKLGVSGPLGGGAQHWPWVSLHDEAAAIVHLLTSSVAGPVNITGPTPAVENEIGRALAEQLHRPYAIPAPRFALELALGDAGRELLLADQLVTPAVLLADGFSFRHTTSTEAITAAVESWS
ncbi:TIGR01777 family oxidoreductase [Naasia lichenicola]|uniref:TIGR01777 family protein n=1 Tax=Naasia lichenicola TaxID=2565933 RepID=A0A4S4FP08_9MICO|nr:TIGR01777 family oxidoreductase [Naasia lichenicola]THG32300.1 TIGR01777 family protein [Naasia lichenicola]